MEKTINECFYQIQNGANIKQGDVEGGFPITRIETTANDKFNRDRMGYAGITDISKYEAYVLEDGDLLMSHINSVQYLGRTVLYIKQPDEIIIHGMNLLRLKARRNIINPAYARYCFYGHTFRCQIGNITKKSVNQASFAVKDLKQIKIEVPSLDVQNKVVVILDRVQKIIDMRNNELASLDDLIKARFVEMFGSIHESTKYPYIAVKDLTDVTSGGTPSRDKTEYWDNGTIPWVKTTELQNNVLIDVDEHITEAGLAGSSAKLVPVGTILVAMYGQGKTRGMTAYLGVEASTNQACACILPSDKVDSMFMWKYFELSYDKLRSLAQGAGQPNLNGNMIKNFQVLVPPIELQKEYVDFVNQINKSKVVDIDKKDKL